MNGKSARKVSVFASAWFLVAVSVVGCASSSKKTIAEARDVQSQPQPTPTQSAESTASFKRVTDYDAQALLGHRAPFVGDNSKVVALVDLLPLPGGLSREAIELQTSEEPYGITIHYNLDQDAGLAIDVRNGDPFDLEHWLYRHAAIMMSLIGNADYIDFKVDDARTISGDQDRYEYRLGRNDIEAVYGDIRKLADDEKSFADYVGKIRRLGAVDLSPRKALQPGSDGKYLLSHNEVRTASGDVLYVNLEMIDGKHYTEEEAGGPGGGTYADNYRGSYQLRVAGSGGETLTTYKALGGELNFGGTFEFAWADYNDDGNPDFTLGQYFNSNGSFYEIYSLNERGEIEKLNTDRDLYIADSSHSILLDQVDATSFSAKYYNQESGYEHRLFNWDGISFKAATADASQ